MKYMRVVLLMAGLMLGARDLALAADANFTLTDVPGRWYDQTPLAPTGSPLAIIAPGEKVRFHQVVESRHTITSLIWPSNSTLSERIDQDVANTADHEVTLTTPGLYVFVCKLHPYMLGGVIVDSADTTSVEIGQNLTLLGVGSFPSNSNLGLRLLRAFFIVTNPSNWKDYAQPVGTQYHPAYPAVDVNLGTVLAPVVVPLKTTIENALDKPNGDFPLIQLKGTPTTKGIGEVWVDTQFELTDGKGPSFPGTITVVDVGAPNAADRWKVTKKIALPAQKMNNGHNMWASHNQEQIYQTEWHGKSLFVLDRVNGNLLQEVSVGEDPAHVMTRVNTQQVHVTLNGEDGVVELNRAPTGLLTFNRVISMQDPKHPTKPTQPHAHWMGFDGQTMATPNANSNDSSLFDFIQDKVIEKNPTGALPIAASMMPDSSKYYVSNYLGHSLSVMHRNGNKIKDINLLAGYDPLSGACTGTCAAAGGIGGLPIQTPVSPDGKFVITGNTLTASITIVDTATDTVVKVIPCDPGCHGVNFGAKQGGGYYAYVTSKFANRLIVLDYDPNNDGNASDAVVAGDVLLANSTPPIDDLGGVTGNPGMGGQGVLPVPNVYNGWVQQLPNAYKIQLTPAQRAPIGKNRK